MRLTTGAAGLLLATGLVVLSSPARAGLADDLAYCQANVWPKFAGWSLSRQRGPDSPSTPEDHYCLALGYWSGQAQFQPKDLVKAAQYAQTAAAQGHPGAQGLLGFFYSKGNGVNQDQAAAIAWWKKAAAQGHADSLNALASAYDNGQRVPADKNEALRLYRLAADRGSKEARQRLATRDKPQTAQPGQPDFDEGVRLYKAGQHAAAAKLFLRAAEQAMHVPSFRSDTNTTTAREFLSLLRGSRAVAAVGRTGVAPRDNGQGHPI